MFADKGTRVRKKTAAAEGRTLASVIEDALRESLARRERQMRREPVRFPTFRGDGLMPGVDLDDNASLLDIVDEDLIMRLKEGGG